MKKFKKNFSKTFFASFFVFQFVVSTSFMPLIVNAEDVASASEESSTQEETSPEISKEEIVSEESVQEENIELEVVALEDGEITDFSTVEKNPIDETEVITQQDSNLIKEPKDLKNLEGENPIKPTDDKKSSALIKVCKVILDENGNQVEGSEFPGAVFSLKLGIQDSLKTVTLAADDYADKRFVYEGNNAFHAMCDEIELAFDVSLVVGPNVIAEYTEEETSGDYVWDKKYNDSDVSGDAGFQNKLWSFGADENADGKFILTGNTTTGFKGTILLVNKFTGYTDPGASSKGSISVCKIIAKRVNGNVVLASASEVPGYMFTVPWIDEPTTPGTEGFNTQPIISPDATFATNTFSPNKKILSSSNGNDAMCQTFSDLTLGSYYYGEETISGGDDSVTWTTKYSDQVLRPVDAFDDVDFYRDNIFTVGLDLGLDPRGSIDANGNPFNTNADGHIVLNRSNAGRNRTIIVVNIFEDKNEGDTNTPPKLSINPSVICIQTDALSYDYFGGVTANDIEDGDITSLITYITNPSPVVLGVEGEYVITYTVVDSKGLTDTGARTLYIKENCGGGGDSKNPILTVPGQVCLLTGVTLFDFNAGVSATDDEGLANVTITNNGSTVVNFGTVGTYTVTYTATDSDGNTDVETRNIVISTNCNGGGGNDNDPTITFGGQSCILTSATSFDFTSGVTVTDDEGAGNVTVTNNSATAVTFGTAGSYTVTYIATDSDGNVTTATRTFTIDDDCGTGGGDNNPPTITITGGSCIETSATSFDFLVGVTATDDLDGTITLNLTDNVFGEENVLFGTAGTYTVTYTASDSLLETTTTTRTITISTDCDNGGGGGDNDPTITFGGQSCILTSATSFDFTSGVTVTDDEGAGNVTVTNNSATAVTFGTAGSYTVTYIATDSDGNVTTATRTFTIDDDCDNGGGGGGDNDPNLAIPSDVCIETSVTSFDFNAGVTATDDEGTDNVTITNNGSTIVTFGSNGTYIITYTATDSDGNTDVVTRTFTISEDCDNGGGGGGGGGGGNGGGSSSGSRRNNGGEVLGAATCVAFTTYNRLGNSGGEIKALQTFLNEYMDAGLTVDGVYGRTTAQAVHDFQAFHWSEVIDPWTPPLSPNTTGWQYKTTRMTINAIIDCPEPAVYLEDPGVMYEVKEVKDQKSFTIEQMETIYNLLAEAQSGNVLGSSDVNTNTTNIFYPNYDLMYGK